MKKKIMLAAIFSMVSLSGCKDNEKIPVEYIYEVETLADGTSECRQYKVVSYDPLKVATGEKTNCPKIVFGFHYKNVPFVMDWIRNAQEQCKEK